MNRVVHFEIHAKDLDGAQKFYGGIFGWKISDLGPQMGNYRMVSTGDDEVGARWPGINGGITPRVGPRGWQSMARNLRRHPTTHGTAPFGGRTRQRIRLPHSN